MLHAFIDTNALLHYPPLAEVDWCAVCGSKEVTILLCLPVLDELDKHKNNPRLADRASKRIKEIKERRGTEIRPGVRLDVYPAPVHPAEFPDTLDRESADDRIVHSALKYRQGKSEEVVIITEDIGMVVRAEAHEVRVVSPPEKQRLASPMSEEQRLQREINEIKNRLPKLSVNFEPMVHQLKRRQLVDAGEKVAKTEELALQAIKGRAQYKPRVTRFLLQARQWFDAQNAIIDESARTFDLYIGLMNEGKAPAKKVDLTVEFPDKISAIYYNHNLWGNRTRSSPPVPAENQFFKLHFTSVEPYPREINALYGGAAQGIVSEGVFHLDLDIVPQGHDQVFGPFFLTFRSWEDVGNFAVDVTLRTLEPPDLHRFQQVFEVVVEDVVGDAETSA